MGPMLLQEPFSHVVNNIFVLFKFYNKDVDMITRNNLGSYCSVKFKPPISIMPYITTSTTTDFDEHNLMGLGFRVVMGFPIGSHKHVNMREPSQYVTTSKS